MSYSRSNRLSWLAALAITAFFAAFGAAHASAQNATVLGHVTDSSGAAVPGATVSVTNQDTGVARTVTAGADGAYLVPDLIPGKYTIKYAMTGFATLEVKDLVLEVNQQVNRTDKLTVAAQATTVEVTGVSPPVDTTESQVAGVVTSEQIENLPVQNRQYLNLATLEPGTTQNGSRSFYNNVQIGGSDYYYTNSFSVDGVNNTWAEMGEPRENFPEGSIEEFRVYTNQFKANEGGMAMGGAISIATKSGTNNIHGEGFEYFRNQALAVETRFQKASQAASGQANVAPPLRRNEYGFDLGGPVMKNKLHYYVADEQQQQVTSYTMFETPGTPAATTYAAFMGVFPQPSHDDMLTGRVDWQISDKQQLFARYGQEWNLVTCQGCGGHTFSSGGTYDGQFPRESIVVGDTYIATPAVVNDVRFQAARAEYLLSPTGCPSACGANIWTVFGQYPAARLAAFATTLSFPNFTWGASYGDNGDEKHYEVSDNLSIFDGHHHIQLGFDDQYVPYSDEILIGVNGSYSFGADPSTPLAFADQPLNGKAAGPTFSAANLYTGSYGPTSFSQTLPPVLTTDPTAQVTLYGQDDWQVTPRVTLALGLRWDREYGSFDENINPSTYLGYEQTNFSRVFCPTSACAGVQPIPGMGNPATRGYNKNFAPRLGATWDLHGNGRDVIRAGFGIYYNNILTLQNYSEIRDLEQFSASLPIAGVQASCTTSQTGPANQRNAQNQPINPQCPGYPNPFVNATYNSTNPSQFAGGNIPSGLVVYPQNFRNPYSEQFNVGYSREITTNFSLHFDGVHTNSYRDYQGYDINIPSVYLGTRPDAYFGTISDRFPTSQSHYNAFDVRVDKRMSKNFQFLVSYTLSECIDNSPEGSITNYQDYDQQFGDCSIDQRDALSASVTWHAPLGVTVGLIQSNRSSQPFGVPSYVTGPNSAALVAANGGTAYPYKNNDGSALPLQGMNRDQGARNINYTLLNNYVTSGPGTEASFAALTAACGENASGVVQAASVNALSYSPQCFDKILTPLAAVTASQLTERRLNETDIRIARDFKILENKNLELVAQVFNLFGVYNYSGVTTSPTSFSGTLQAGGYYNSVGQTWGQATGSNPLQVGELAAKITF